MHFNEDARVKIPALLHLVRLGYAYIPRNEHEKRNEISNIFPDIFKESIARLNPGISETEINNLYSDLHLKLDYDDLGRDFYENLVSGTGRKLFDFQHPEKNSYHVATELTCKNGDEEFRPDITLLINGMPLVFIEVKKPNNKEGVIAERKRINNLLKAKYEHDEKYVRVHKRMMETKRTTETERKLHEALLGVKHITDERLLRDRSLLSNEEFFKNEIMTYVIQQFIDKSNIGLNVKTTDQINQLIVNEYYNDYRGIRI